MKINILDLIDFEKVDTLLEGFNKSTGFVTAILDLDGKVLSKSGWRQICTEFHRINPETSQKCTISDTELANKLAEGKKYHFYKCLNGLIDVAVPIVINGEHIANLFSGQFFFEEPDRMVFMDQARKYGFDEKKYLEALAIVPVVSKEKVLVTMDFLLNMTQLISEMTFQKLEQIELNSTIKESEEKFKSVFESANVGKSITLPTGEIIVNKAFCDMLGYTREELLNKKWQDITPKDEIPAIQELTAPLLRGEKDSVRFEKRYICKNGTHIWADFSTSIRRDKYGQSLHFITTVIDITERKQAEEKLKKNEEKYRHIFENVQDVYYETLLDGTILEVSPSIENISKGQYHRGDLIGKSIYTFYSDPNDRDTLIEAMQKTGNVNDFEIQLKNRDDSVIYCSISAKINFDAQGQPEKIIGSMRDISARKHANDELEKQNVYIKMILDNFPIGIATNEIDSMKVTYMNRKFSEIYGWPKDEFSDVGTFFEKVFPNIEYRQQMQTRIMADISSGAIELMNWDDLKITTKAGDQRIVNASNIPLLDQNIMVSTVQDITERKLAEEELLQSYLFSNSLLKTIPFGMDIVDESGTLLFQNDNFKKLFGEDAIGKKCWELYRNNKSQCSDCPLLKEIKIGETASYVSDGVLGNKIFEIKHTGIIYKGKKAMLEIFQDITHIKEHEKELMQAKEKAEESDRLKTAFLHNISHEIRTPLNGITGFSDILSNPNLSPEKKNHFAKIIRESSDQLISIVDDIISMSTIEAGQEILNESETDINLLLDLLKKQNAPKVNAKNISFTVISALNNKEKTILTDKTKLLQILTNLVSNAIKFTSEGYIKVYCALEGNYIKFIVEDTGIGIPPEMHGKIFSRFFQIENSDIRSFGGNGLGLSIVKSYVNFLKGEVSLNSIVGKGSAFCVSIPYCPVEQPKPINIPVHDYLKPIKKVTILIAEDEEFNYLLLEELLSEMNANLIRATDGLKAIEICKNNSAVDLILMDLKMSGMDGYEATRHIREFKPDLPIIAQSAYSTDSDKNKAMACGCNDFITKPFKQELLISKILEQLADK